MRQLVQLYPIHEHQLGLAIDRSMEHGDEVVIPVSDDEQIVLIFDGINGTITGWIEDHEMGG